MRLVLAVCLGGALTGVAHADRMAQAHNIFSDSCARCHSADSLRPKASAQPAPDPEAPLDRNGRRMQRQERVDTLRRWMENPNAVMPDTHCEAGHLDAVQRELVLSFLRKKTNPLMRSRVMVRVPEQNNGLAPPLPKPHPLVGQGDHR
ncbi:MAG: hypothetical protein ABI321_15995 [Polyangia bacterium]